MQTKKWSCFYLPKNPPFLPVLWWTTRLKPSSMLQLPALILSYLTLPFISHRIRSPIFSESLTLLDDHLQMICTILINPVLHLSPPLPSWILHNTFQNSHCVFLWALQIFHSVILLPTRTFLSILDFLIQNYNHFFFFCKHHNYLTPFYCYEFCLVTSQPRLIQLYTYCTPLQPEVVSEIT